jgi:transcriptional regulator with XRE-family HTH domain
MDLRQRLQIDLCDEEYRHAYADEHLNLSIGTQIKVIREEQRMKQAELAEKIGTKQAGISRLESANYNGWSIAILRRLAQAFDLRLRVSFEEFGTLWTEVEGFSRETLTRMEFKKDPEFHPAGNQLLASAATASGCLFFTGETQADRPRRIGNMTSIAAHAAFRQEERPPESMSRKPPQAECELASTTQANQL